MCSDSVAGDPPFISQGNFILFYVFNELRPAAAPQSIHWDNTSYNCYQILRPERNFCRHTIQTPHREGNFGHVGTSTGIKVNHLIRVLRLFLSTAASPSCVTQLITDESSAPIAEFMLPDLPTADSIRPVSLGVLFIKKKRKKTEKKREAYIIINLLIC